MEASFWHNKWKRDEIGFHRDQVSPFLTKYGERFFQKGEVVFVPLCGKSLDMLYFLSKGMKVIGVELSEKAVKQFFLENEIQYHEESTQDFKIYQAENIKIYCGDLFNLENSELKDITHVYDRASMVALPMDLRKNYISFMHKNFKSTPYFLEALSFDNDEVGPPFSIPQIRVKECFSDIYEIEKLETIRLTGDKIGVHKDKVTEQGISIYHMSPLEE